MGRVSTMGSFVVGGLAVLALAAAVATLIGAITAENDSLISKNCLRECHEGEHYTCLYEFEVARYQTFSWDCKTCANSSCTNVPGCVQADGVTRLITAVNRELPGPAIQVCEGDTVKVVVKNKLLTSGVAIHWHGILMKDRNGERRTPHMDGEPGVTQCPAMPRTTFTYRFVANPVGTHFWQAQTGFQRGDGVFGPLIVRAPKSHDPHDSLYDRDLTGHVIMINDWTHILGEEKFFLHHHSGFTNYPKSILVNGLGPNQGNSIVSIPHPVGHHRFEVTRGYRYRFRVINGGFLNCPISVSVASHILTLIAIDGSSIQPFNVTSFVIYSGERYDFILDANQEPMPYWISFMGQNDCVHDSVYQTAILDYVSLGKPRFTQEELESRYRYASPKPRFTKNKPRGKQLNSLRGFCNFANPCLTNLNSTEKLPENLKKETPDVALYFGFSKMILNDSTNSLVAPLHHRLPTPLINGHSFDYPSTPVIFQMNSYGTCRTRTSEESKSDSSCLHIVKIPLGSVTDLILVEDGKHLSGTVVHLHGHRFYVLAQRGGRTQDHRNAGITLTLGHVRELNVKKKIKKNLLNPVLKDTVALPHRGFVLLRFLADNPGFWMLESQLLFDSQSGMKVILQVGESHQIPKPPLNFPLCGDFL